MTRCNDFYDKVRRDGNFCGMSEKMLTQVEAYIAFVDENPAIAGISEGAALPLMREKDLVVQAKAIEVTGRQLKHRGAPTEVQMKDRLANIAAGKGLQGGKHLGKPEELQNPPVGDVCGNIDTESEEKDPEDVRSLTGMPGERLEDKLGKLAEYCVKGFPEPEESEFIEADPDEVYPYEGDNSGDIPDMPDGASFVAPLPPIVEPTEIEEEPDSREVIDLVIPEVTAKITKENLKNAGHVDIPQKPKNGPTEDGKQFLFAKTVMQALEWGMDGDEIFRRIETAIMFAIQKDREEKVVCA